MYFNAQQVSWELFSPDTDFLNIAAVPWIVFPNLNSQLPQIQSVSSFFLSPPPQLSAAYNTELFSVSDFLNSPSAYNTIWLNKTKMNPSVNTW